MADDREELAEAVRDVADAASDTQAALAAAEAATEAAEVRAEAAEEAAELLAEAALRDGLRQAFEQLKAENDEWRASIMPRLESLEAANQSLAAELANLRTSLEAQTANPPQTQVSLIPENSPIAETLEQAEAVTGQIVAPESAPSGDAPVVLALAAKPRRGRFL